LIDGFDAHAIEYQRRWEEDLTGAALRRRLQGWLAQTFPTPARILDLGCGIGSDSAFLLGLGHEVQALDASAGMVAEARLRAPGARPRQGRVEELQGVGAGWDGALLNCGVINCLEDPATAARALAPCLRPGGQAMVVSMPRLHPSGLWGMARRGRWKAAWQRCQRRAEVPVAGALVPTWYWGASELISIWRPFFAPRWIRSLGLLLPAPGSRPRPALLRALEPWDQRLGSWPLARRVGDHVAVLFQRVPDI
jgi:SAM-dependent methyltransferase